MSENLELELGEPFPEENPKESQELTEDEARKESFS
jgi:hypothetical protein